MVDLYGRESDESGVLIVPLIIALKLVGTYGLKTEPCLGGVTLMTYATFEAIAKLIMCTRVSWRSLSLSPPPPHHHPRPIPSSGVVHRLLVELLRFGLLRDIGTCLMSHTFSC